MLHRGNIREKAEHLGSPLWFVKIRKKPYEDFIKKSSYGFCDIHLFVVAGAFITNKFLSVPEIVLDFPDEENVWHDPHKIFQWQDLSSYSHLQFF